MAFSDYKNISQVQQQFRIIAQEERFLDAVAKEPSLQFILELLFRTTTKIMIVTSLE